ncbi:hypothetical protein DTY82_07930 [Escherichia coli]|uniref:Uncharacterized protein n=1 Tax=Escherichia coli TaxID=562 RepID=A0A8B3LYR6_ECOLX|nr:hypothetical protein [Escherichia coli]EFO2287971.1 hypothetical protein [Escherichia coli O148]EFO1400495.1 hypothetical protein [Escherichia coli]EGD4854953.1 hypothetical protein [Escherichia coli]EGD5023981.1 hypothetical protein [Escherichia coli]
MALLWQTPSAQARGKKRNGKAASEVFYYVAAKDRKFARRYEERWGEDYPPAIERINLSAISENALRDRVPVRAWSARRRR